jgi:hypothetical protein
MNAEDESNAKDGTGFMDGLLPAGRDDSGDSGASHALDGLSEHAKDEIAQLFASEGHGSDPNFIPQEIKRIVAEDR